MWSGCGRSRGTEQIGLPGDSRDRKHQRDIMRLSDASLKAGRVAVAAAEVAFTEDDFCVNGVRTRGVQITSVSLLGNSLLKRGITSSR